MWLVDARVCCVCRRANRWESICGSRRNAPRSACGTPPHLVFRSPAEIAPSCGLLSYGPQIEGGAARAGSERDGSRCQDQRDPGAQRTVRFRPLKQSEINSGVSVAPVYAGKIARRCCCSARRRRHWLELRAPLPRIARRRTPRAREVVRCCLLARCPCPAS